MLNINKELSIMRKWLKDIRLAKGLSQLDVAKKVHITFQYYSYIENGERRPSRECKIVCVKGLYKSTLVLAY